MPLKPKLRGNTWHAHGRVEYDGRPITGFLRISTGSSTEAGAWAWIRDFEDRQKRRHLLGDEAEQVTFAMAVLEHKAKPVDAGYLAFVLANRPEVGQIPIAKITGKFLKNLGLELYPHCSTDTVWRSVVSPMRSVINNMHELGKGPPLRVRAFTEKERIDRDKERGKQSRIPKKASDKSWIEAFCEHADRHNAAMVRFMFETAARIDQAVSLRPADLDIPGCKVLIKAQKGHAQQWVDVSQAMMDELAELPPKRPRKSLEGKTQELRVFGYATRTGYRKRWQAICKAAGIEYLRAHEAGRHGFGTELMVRQGLDPVTVAKHGRWKSAQLVFNTYGHAERSASDIRELMRTPITQPKSDGSGK